MQPAVLTTTLGLLTLAFGCIGLLDPLLVMGFVGFVAPANGAAVMGEVRAVYGGLFIVLGLYTVAAAFNPAKHGARLLLIGLLWLGLCSGRVLGIALDGNPGIKGWGSAVLELLMGICLVVVSRTRTSDGQSAESRDAA